MQFLSKAGFPGLGPINKKFQGLKNFQKKAKNFKHAIFVKKARKIV
jgi:hypothetical protein